MKVGILGATGFTGEKLAFLLAKHPNVELVYLSSRTPKPVPYSSIFPEFKDIIDLNCETLDVEKAAKKADILFLSLPHTVSMEFVPKLLKKGKKVIDLSADYRIENPPDYKKYYKTAHKDKDNLTKAVYGMAELFKSDIAKAQLIANPGCYPTAVILGLAPLVKAKLIDSDVFVDAKSSITGAGRKAVLDYHYSYISNNIWAYKPFAHQHVPEMQDIIQRATKSKVNINFVPQVVGVDAGIYANIYCKLKKKKSQKDLVNLYKKQYKNCPFVRMRQGMPKLSDVVATNFCDIGIAVDEKKKYCVISSCIDNLIKGAAGSAVQNMNIMVGLEETTGLL